jgi:TonB-dependent SusC/RagA subfamily outer membrane receptor
MRTISILLLLPLLVASCSASRQNSQYVSNPGDEIVDIGYTKARRDAVTGSVSKVKMDNTRIYSNIYEFLEGKVPGLTVQGESIRIRGNNSLLGSNEPLILVDGVEFTNISDLNPNDVESVDVLKDGTASIYGVRGNNGVILIKMKK